jgi:hypothetical protein
VIFYGLDRDKELFADFFIAHSLDEKSDDLLFPVGDFKFCDETFQAFLGNGDGFYFETVFPEKMMQIKERGNIYREKKGRKKEVVQDDIAVKGEQKDVGKKDLQKKHEKIDPS